MSDIMRDIYAAEKAKAELEAEIGNNRAKAELDRYNARCDQHRADGIAFAAELRSIHPDITDIEVIQHTILAGLGPRVYNPPLSAMVRYIVHS